MTTFPANATPTLVAEPRKLLLLFDDAAYPFQTNYSNIMKLFLLLRNDDSQMVYYEVSAHFSLPNILMCL